ncbi:hypothetical protein Tco_1158081 [Tanacetum coccineum]
MMIKNPPLEQTGGPKEEGQEKEFEIGVHDEQEEEESVPAVHESVQPWLSNLARRQDPRESFDELTDTTFDFSAFVMNRLNVKTLTPELLAGPTFELMKGTCKSLTELEYFCEEVYKATTEKLDWINPEGRQYPHDLRQPLPLVLNSQGRHVIPFHHFINNDLEYLRGGESSRKYSTSVTKTMAADYGHIKWIEDLFYAFATTRESARDVYSKRRIIAVTKVEIVEWHNYKHLDWITVRRDDDILYKFKEGDFQRLRIQDIEDMLLLLVQGKVTNLNVEERIAFNVSLRMFTRSVVIQRRVEDLQLGVESYQKKLNLTKPDTYRSNLRRRDAYTPYSDPRGFIYENKDKKNRLMRIDELHKFSDGTLDDVRTALNDRLKGIRMEYLPQTFWSQRDKANARAMIQAIDKRLKTRRIMRSLERFIGGRPYGEHAEYDESNTYVLERFNTTAGNPVKKILLKLNLSDHRLFKDGGGGPRSHSPQGGKNYKMAQSLCLVDDLKMLQDHMSNKRSRNKLYPKKLLVFYRNVRRRRELGDLSFEFLIKRKTLHSKPSESRWNDSKVLKWRKLNMKTRQHATDSFFKSLCIRDIERRMDRKMKRKGIDKV